MNTAESLTASIDREVGGMPDGKLESHDLNSLSARIAAPVDVTLKLLASGVLRSEGPVYQGDETGRHTFSSSVLNHAKDAVLTAVVERTIQESDGSPVEVKMAANYALRQHADNFKKEPGTKSEFSRFPVCVQLSRYYDEDEPGILRRTTATAGKAAVVGGLGLAGAAFLRGRRLKPGAKLIDQLLTGGRANVTTGRRIAGGLSTGAAKVARVLRGMSAR